MNAIKQKILEQAQRDGVQVTALREQVLDIVLKQSGVIKAYNVLSQMQQQSEGVVAPPTAYHCHDHEEAEAHHSAFILVCTECGTADEQTLSQEWAALRAGVAETGFSLKEEHVVLTGICKKCQK